MKRILVLLILISSAPIAFASESVVATGTVEVLNAARSYEVVIEGAAAEELFETLDSKETQVGEWLNKSARGIICGKNLESKKFACSLNIDGSGVL